MGKVIDVTLDSIIAFMLVLAFITLTLVFIAAFVQEPLGMLIIVTVFAVIWITAWVRHK